MIQVNNATPILSTVIKLNTVEATYVELLSQSLHLQFSDLTMDQITSILEDTSSKITATTKKTDKFLLKDASVYEKARLFTKVLYDVTKFVEVKPAKNTLPELIIENFDAEQVWAGVELQNAEKLHRLEAKLEKLRIADVKKFPLMLGKPSKTPTLEVNPVEEEELAEDDPPDDLSNPGYDDDDKMSNKESDEEEEKAEDDDILNDPDFQNMSDSDGDDLPLFQDLDEDELEEDGDDDEDTTEKPSKRKTKETGRKSEIDDQFFKLSDMEKFHDIEDPKDILKGKDDDGEEDIIDMFGDIPDEDDEAANMMYGDFWNENEGDIPDFDQDEDEGEEDELEDEDDEGDALKSKLLPSSDEEEDDVVKSSHEIAQERLAKKIGKMEEAAVGDKDWQMGGEVSAPVRPENSLLSEHLDYDTAAKQAPIITEEVSRKLEDIILQRIKDKAWDDVERKEKPVEDPYEYKKKLVLDQEKSKLSLAQIYEEEFMKVAEQATEKKQSVGLLDKETDEVPAEVEEIKTMMNGLFRKLDSLSHLHFTPKQKSAELKVVRNIPSIAMEEVAPVAATNAVLLAPEEVIDKKKGELVDDKEKTKTDRKREKREKKAKLKAKIKDKERKEKLVAKAKPGLGNKYSKEKMMKQLEAAEKQGSVININKKNKDTSVKNSKNFFSNLQDEVKTHVREKSASKKSKNKENRANAASYKL